MPNGTKKTKKVKKNQAGAEGGEQTDPTDVLAALDDEQKEAVAALLASKDEQIAELQRSKAGGEGEGGEGGEDDEEEEVEQAQAGAEDGGIPASERQGTGTTVTVAMSKANKEIAELKKNLAKERTLRLQRDFLEKARSFDAIPVPAEKIADLMRVVAEKAKEQAPILDQILKACTELASANGSITKSLGAANGKGAPASAKAEIDSEVAKLIAEDPKLSKGKATERLFKARPALYTRYREEQERRS